MIICRQTLELGNYWNTGTYVLDRVFILIKLAYLKRLHKDVNDLEVHEVIQPWSALGLCIQKVEECYK